MNNNDSNNGNGFSNLLLASPLAVGAGLSIRDIFRNASSIFPRTTLSSPTQDVIGTVSPYVQTQTLADRRVNSFLNYAEGLSSSKVVQGLWGQSVKPAMESGDILFAWNFAADKLPEPFKTDLNPNLLANPIDSLSSSFGHNLPKLPFAEQQNFMGAFRDTIGAIESQRRIYGDAFDPSSLSAVMPEFNYSNEFIEKYITPDDLPSHLQPYFKEIQDQLGFSPDITFKAKREFASEGLGVYKFNVGPGLPVSLPQSASGQILTGDTLGTKWLSGKFGVIDQGKLIGQMPYEEYMMYRFNKDILPRLNPESENAFSSRLEASSALKNLENSLREKLEFVSPIPAENQTSSLKGFIHTKSPSLHFVDIEGNTVSAMKALRMEGIRDLVGEELFPGGVSPTGLAKGKMATIDVRKMFRGWQAVPESRSPRQAFKDVSFMSGGASEYDWLFSDEFKSSYGSSHALPVKDVLFVKPSEVESVMSGGSPLSSDIIFGEGEWEISSELRNQAKGVRQTHLGVGSITQQMQEELKSGSPVTLDRGAVVGYDKYGKPVSLQNRSTISGYTHHGSYLNLMLEEQIDSSQHLKTFGVKGSAIERPAEVMRETAKALNLNSVPQGRMPISALTKESHYLNMQVTSSLWSTIGDKVKRLEASQGEAIARHEFKSILGFIKNPGMVMDKISDLSTIDGKFQESIYINNMMQIAMEADLSPTEFGRVFGAVPEALGDNWASQVGIKGLSPEHIKAAETLSPVGTVFVTHGGSRSLRFDATKRASFEPRIFNQLKAGQYGSFGERVADELAKRATISNPEAIIASEEARRTLMSISGSGNSEWAGNTFKIGKKFKEEIFDEFAKEGGWLSMPGGRDPVYMPSAEKMKLMMPFNISEGKSASSEFANLYKNLARNAVKAEAGGISAIRNFYSESIGKGGRAEGSFWQFAQDIQKQHAVLGKGPLGLFRGRSQRPYGTQFLELASSISDLGDLGYQAAEKDFFNKADAFTVGISDFYFEKMSNDLARSGVSAEEVSRLREAWKAGDEVGGMFWRHPIIGQYSTTPIKFRRVASAGSEPLALMPEILLKSEGILKGKGIGPLIGAAADKDADFGAFMLLHGDLEKEARTFFTNSHNTEVQKYIDHTVRMQFIKPKAQGIQSEMSEVTLKNLSAVATEKLGMTQDYVPKLSLALTEMKEAVAHMPNKRLQNKAWSLLEILEQIPISGKHKSALELSKDISAFERTAIGLVDSLKTSDAQGIQFYTREALGKTALSEQTVNSLLESGIEISQNNADEIARLMRLPAGSVPTKVGGLNLTQVSEYIAEAGEQYSKSPKSRIDKLMAGRTWLKPSEINSWTKLSDMSLSKAATSSKSKEAMGKILSESRLAIQNISAANGNRLMKGLKPLAIGGAVTLAATAFFSSPSETLEQDPSFINERNQQLDSIRNQESRAAQLGAESLGSAAIGSPRGPGRVSTPTVRLGNRSSYSVNAEIDAPEYMVDPEGFVKNLEEGAGNVGEVNVTINDRRDKLSIHKIMNEIY